MLGLVPTSALSSDAGVAGLPAKSLKINERFNAGVAGSARQAAGGRSSSRICVRRSATFAELWNKSPGTGQDAHLTTETTEFDEGRTYRPLREQ